MLYIMAHRGIVFHIFGKNICRVIVNNKTSLCNHVYNNESKKAYVGVVTTHLYCEFQNPSPLSKICNDWW